MKAAMIISLAVLAVATSTQVSEESSLGSSLTFDASAAKKRPVAKVINLLKDMMKQMKKEAEEDEDVYDKFACWSETNMKDKTKSIADANSKISDLTASIDARTAQAARLNTEIADLTTEAAADTKALEEATALRAKELAEFNAEEKSVIMTIMSLKNALISLSKHNSFLQSASQMQGVAVTVQDALNSHASLLAGALTPTQRRAVSAFVQSPTVTQTGGYAPQSGEIVGILKQMQETFETNLAATQKQEKANVAAFIDLKAAKEAEIKAGNDQIDTKSDQLAENNDKMAQEKRDRKDTEKSLAADEKFYGNVKNAYATEKGEYETRVNVRTEELAAVSKAEEILNGDDAHDLFGKSLGFMQTAMQADRRSRSQAAELLIAVAHKVQNPRLSTMAVAVRLDAFVKVKKAIDEMIAQLKVQKADERKQKDFCTESLNQNAMKIHRATVEKNDLTALIAKLKADIQTLQDAIKALEADIALLQKNLKIATDARDTQRKEFEQTVADQRASQKVLASAMTVLKNFYAANAEHAPETGLLQTKQPLMAGGSDYKSSGASGKVMNMIQSIIDDAKRMEEEAMRDEAEAEKAHAAFTKETNDTIKIKNDSIANKRAIIADKKADLVEASKDQEDNALLLEQLDLTKQELHQDCDFALKNFNVRQAALDTESDALAQAKAILSGQQR